MINAPDSIRNDFISNQSENSSSQNLSVVQQSFFHFESFASKKEFVFDFEIPYLKHTFDYYQKNTQKIQKSAKLDNYLQIANSFIQNELNMAVKCNSRFKIKLLKIVLKATLLNQDGNELYEMTLIAVTEIFDSSNFTKMKKYFQMYRRNHETLNVFTKCIQNILNLADDIKADLNSDVNLSKITEKMLLKIEKMYIFLELSFDNNVQIEQTLTASLKYLSNIKLNDLPNLAIILPIYIDTKMKYFSTIENSDKGNFGNLFDKKIEIISRILYYTVSNEEFFVKYAKLLAERLLSSSEKAAEIELTIIKIINKRVNNEILIKMFKMVEDILSSFACDKIFQRSLLNTNTKSLLKNVKILYRKMWPSSVQNNDFLMHSLHQNSLFFQNFYKKLAEDRKIEFSTNIGFVVIKANLGQSPFKLRATLIQAKILSLLSSKNELTIEEISKIIGISLENLKIHLKPLVHPRFFKILLKMPSKGFDKSHILKVNLDCSPPIEQVNLPLGKFF